MAKFQAHSVTRIGDLENTCSLNLEWSEGIASCGGSVNYNLSVIPDVEGWYCTEYLFWYREQIYLHCEWKCWTPVQLVSLTTEICDGQNITISGVNLSGILSKYVKQGALNQVFAAVSGGSESIYYYLYNVTSSLTRQQLIGVNVTWPRFKVIKVCTFSCIELVCLFCQILGTDVVYRLIINHPDEIPTADIYH